MEVSRAPWSARRTTQVNFPTWGDRAQSCVTCKPAEYLSALMVPRPKVWADRTLAAGCHLFWPFDLAKKKRFVSDLLPLRASHARADPRISAVLCSSPPVPHLPSGGLPRRRYAPSPVVIVVGSHPRRFSSSLPRPMQQLQLRLQLSAAPVVAPPPPLAVDAR